MDERRLQSIDVHLQLIKELLVQILEEIKTTK